MRRVVAAALVIGYLLVVGGVVLGLSRARQHVQQAMDNRQAREAWNQWVRWVEESQKKGGPVQRDVPKANEPPALILLRDHYPACLSVALLLSSVLYAVLSLMLYGVLFGTRTPPAAAVTEPQHDPPAA